MKKIIYTLFILIFLGLGAYLYLLWEWSPTFKEANVYLAPGSSVAQIAEELEKSGVIRHAWSFKLLLRLEKSPKALQAGEYNLSGKYDASEILKKIQRGDRVFHKLTIPEGLRWTQIQALLIQAKIGSAAEFNAAFADEALRKKLGFEAASLEGYLFPDTYTYDRGTKPQEMLALMLKTFDKNFDAPLRQRAQQMGWSIPQVVTLASIVEKETGRAEERARISAVFHNRLKLGMLLQTDPTVIYGIPNFDGNLRRVDLQNTANVYNTYANPGLPPTPIASPGKESLRAALFPETSNYLYFVAKGDGTHQFSETLAEHEAAVDRYQRKINPPTP